jgi:hypothetical protein
MFIKHHHSEGNDVTTLTRQWLTDTIGGRGQNRNRAKKLKYSLLYIDYIIEKNQTMNLTPVC